MNDGTYEAAEAYLDAKGHVLWGDYSLRPGDNQSLARWLEAQVRGVADHYDGGPPARHTTDTERTEATLPRTLTNEAPSRPSALITHGQQAERW